MSNFIATITIGKHEILLGLAKPTGRGGTVFGNDIVRESAAIRGCISPPGCYQKWLR